MFTIIDTAVSPARRTGADIDPLARSLFALAQAKGIWFRLGRRLRGQSAALKRFEGRIQGRAYLATVSLDCISGTVSRADDFDAHFYPRTDHNETRWAQVATLMAEGAPLPPVELVSDGQRYYVVDGHHRISAARLLGRLEIDAQIIELPEGSAEVQ